MRVLKFRHRGASAISYAFPLGLIAVIGVAALASVGRNVSQLFYSVGNRMGGVSNGIVVSNPPAAPDTTPDAFVFSATTNAAMNTPIYSNIVQINGLTAPAAVSFSGLGGDGGWRSCVDSACVSEISPYSTSAGTVSNGNYVQLAAVTTAVPAQNRTVSLTISGVTGNWSITNEAISCSASSSATTSGFGISSLSVPANIAGCKFTITIDGAGGAGGTRSPSNLSRGGGGGRLIISFFPGTTGSFSRLAGRGGQYNTQSSSGITGGGGGAGQGGGGGGGASAVSFNSVVLGIAGGGGGGGYSGSSLLGAGGGTGSAGSAGTGYNYGGDGSGTGTSATGAGGAGGVTGANPSRDGGNGGSSAVSGGVANNGGDGTTSGGGNLPGLGGIAETAFLVSGGGGGGHTAGTCGSYSGGGGGGGGFGGGGGGGCNGNGAGGGGGGGYANTGLVTVSGTSVLTNYGSTSGTSNGNPGSAGSNGVVTISWAPGP